MNIKIGTTGSATVMVDSTNTAEALGSGLLAVFATPYMIALMEGAASNSLLPFLEEGQSSVGTVVSIEHLMATPIGMEVTTTATVTLVDRRRVEFDVLATTKEGTIGKGTHTRFIVDSEKFMKQTNSQL